MKQVKHALIMTFAASLLFLSTAQTAFAQEDGGGGAGGGGLGILVGPQAELGYVRGPNYPSDPNDSKTGLLVGLYVGTSGLELRPQALIVEGGYRGFLMDAGLRVTPKWFGQDEYLFNLISPYVVLGGSLGYPWSAGWSARAGLGLALMQFGSINAEIGWRSHRFDASTQIDGITVGLRAAYPF